MVFGLAAPAIEILVERARVAFAQIGDDETRIGPFRADFDAGDDPLDAAPALGAVEELLERRTLPSRGAAFKRAFAPASRVSTRRRKVEAGATPRM